MESFLWSSGVKPGLIIHYQVTPQIAKSHKFLEGKLFSAGKPCPYSFKLLWHLNILLLFLLKLMVVYSWVLPINMKKPEKKNKSSGELKFHCSNVRFLFVFHVVLIDWLCNLLWLNSRDLNIFTFQMLNLCCIFLYSSLQIYAFGIRHGYFW